MIKIATTINNKRSWKGEVLTLKNSRNVNGHKWLKLWLHDGHDALDIDLLKVTARNTGGPCKDVARSFPLMDRTWLCPELTSKLLKNNKDNKDIKATQRRSFTFQTVASEQTCIWRNKRNMRNVYWTGFNT